MKKQDIIKALKKIKKQFPEVKQIQMDYCGSGDSFDSYSWIRNEDGNHLDLNSELYEDIAEELFILAGTDFNNEGSEGTITLDLENMDATIDNYYIVYEKMHSGTHSLLN